MKKKAPFVILIVISILLCTFIIIQRKNDNSRKDDAGLKTLNNLIYDLESPDVDTDTDSDNDGISDYFETIFETSPTQLDTDGDGLPDSIELLSLLLSPLSKDTDDNDVEDGYEDTDSDGLTNLNEYNLGTDIANPDTDGDGLSDGDEINAYNTDPLLIDTDSDGVNDAVEIEIGSNPCEQNSSFNRVYECQSDSNKIKSTLQINGLSAEQTNFFSITLVTSGLLADSQIPGYIDTAFTFSEISDFDSAVISMELAPALFEDELFSPSLYWYDRGNQLLIEVPEQQVSGNVVSCVLSHFSDYILLNSTEQNKVWNIQIPFDDADLVLDTDNDGICDYYEKELAKGILRLGTGAKLTGIDYQNPDCDNDGLKDGQEIKVKRLGNLTYVYMYSNPLLADTDGDNIGDAEDFNPLVKDKSEIVLWQSLNPAGRVALKDEKGLIQVNKNGVVKTAKAEDMGINDENENTLRQKQNYEENKKFIDSLISYANETEESVMWENFQKLIEIGCCWPQYKVDSFPLSPVGVIDTFSPEYFSENLAIIYNGRFMLEHFRQGDGISFYPDADFLNAMLKYGQVPIVGNGIENSITNVMAQVKNFVISTLESNRGELSVLEYNLKNELRYLEQDLRYKEQEKVQKGSGQPPLIDNATADYHKNISKAEFLFGSYILSGGRKSPLVAFNGLGILIHDFQGYEVTIHDYKLESGKFSGKIHFKYYDHFGLDLNDVLSYSSGIKGVIGQYFRDWYCLQHMQRFKGKYKPFINYFDFEDIEFSGTVKMEPEDIELSVTGNVVDQHNGSPIEGATVKLYKKAGDTEIASAKTDLGGTFRINKIPVKYNGVRVGDDFWDTYYLTIQKTGYETDRRINSNLSLVDSSDMSLYVYNLNDIELTAVNMRDVDIESMPEFEALNNLLLYTGGSFYSSEYHCDANNLYSDEDANILDSLLTGGFFPYYAVGANAIMTKWYDTETKGNVPVPDAPWSWNLVYDAERMDWILKSVFNVSDKQIRDIKYACQNTPESHWYYYQDGYYYIRDMEVTLLYDIPVIISAKYDGTFYYIVYDAVFEGSYDLEGKRYAVLSIKNRDGQDYWSLYHWCPSVPEEYDWGESHSDVYRRLANESFWNAYYDESIIILQTGFESTKDMFLRNRYEGIQNFLSDYEDEIYQYGHTVTWNVDHYDIVPDYYYVGKPIAFDNIMGLPGFYIEAPTNVSFCSHDYYAFLPDGEIIYIGGSYGYYDVDEEYVDDYFNIPEEAGDHIVDIDDDGITELICNCISGGDGWLTTKIFRMKNGILERATLDDDLFLNDVPNADWHRRIMDHYDAKTNTFVVWYTTTPESGEIQETKRYTKPDVYSFDKMENWMRDW